MSEPIDQPQYTTTFIGRKEEVDLIMQALSQVHGRLVTLTGPGGIGKTRLAVEVAAMVGGTYPDGYCFIALGENGSTDHLVAELLNGLDVPATGAPDLVAVMLRYLRCKKILLVIDGFERLSAETTLLEHILADAPGVNLLVTSQARLNLSAEGVIEVRGLAYPRDPSDQLVERYDSVRLFVECARRVDPAFAPDTEGWQWIARFCQLVEGMPLAIELAAAATIKFSCEEIYQNSARTLDFLSNQAANVAGRHGTLRTVVEQSWQLLSTSEQEILRLLSIFEDDFSIHAARILTGASAEVLLSLTDKSMLGRRPLGYRMHAIIRRYAREMLAGRPEECAAAIRAYCDLYAAYLESKGDDLCSNRQAQAVSEIDAELENISVAWQKAIDTDHHQMIARSIEALTMYFELKAWYQRAEHLFARAAKRFETTERTTSLEDRRIVAARARLRQGFFAFRQDRLAEATELFDQSLAVFRRLSADRFIPLALFGKGLVLFAAGDFNGASQAFQRSLNLLSDEGDLAMNNLSRQSQSDVGPPTMQGMIFSMLGRSAMARGRFREAESFYQHALAIYTTTGEPLGLGQAYCYLGIIAYQTGRYQEAQDLIERGMDQYHQVAYQGGLAVSMIYLGNIAVATGSYPSAQEHFRRALRLAMDIGSALLQVDVLLGLAELYKRTKRKKRAVELAALAANHPAASGLIRMRARGMLDELVTELPPDAYRAAYKAGEEKSLDDEVAAVLSHLAERA